jgi:hypothetical protein
MKLHPIALVIITLIALNISCQEHEAELAVYLGQSRFCSETEGVKVDFTFLLNPGNIIIDGLSCGVRPMIKGIQQTGISSYTIPVSSVIDSEWYSRSSTAIVQFEAQGMNSRYIFLLKFLKPEPKPNNSNDSLDSDTEDKFYVDDILAGQQFIHDLGGYVEIPREQWGKYLKKSHTIFNRKAYRENMNKILDAQARSYEQDLRNRGEREIVPIVSKLYDGWLDQLIHDFGEESQDAAVAVKHDLASNVKPNNKAKACKVKSLSKVSRSTSKGTTESRRIIRTQDDRSKAAKSISLHNKTLGNKKTYFSANQGEDHGFNGFWGKLGYKEDKTGAGSGHAGSDLLFEEEPDIPHK